MHAITFPKSTLATVTTSTSFEWHLNTPGSHQSSLLNGSQPFPLSKIVSFCRKMLKTALFLANVTKKLNIGAMSK